MRFDNLKQLMVSDLIYLYDITNDKKYYNEIKERILFCGFNIKMLDLLINFENEIISLKKEKYDKPLKEKHWIIGKKNNEHIFSNPNDYMYDPENINPKTLLLSETQVILDEAVFLTYSRKIINYKAKDEIFHLSQENQDNWLFYEFKNRMEYLCRCADHIIDGPKIALYNEQTGTFYDNEMQICMSRWSVDISARNFEPYTEQYYC